MMNTVFGRQTGLDVSAPENGTNILDAFTSVPYCEAIGLEVGAINSDISPLDPLDPLDVEICNHPDAIYVDCYEGTHKEEKLGVIPIRSSTRVSSKKLLHSQSVPIIPPATNKSKEKEKSEEKVLDVKAGIITGRRVHELWSTEDKNSFFEGLNEYGKDFCAIQTYMNNKRKKRGISHIISKNRDQARHFYYRTWHKIAKYLKFPNEVKKVVQEQYGLINFGEFRKKIGFVDGKNAIKLNELIYSGTTQVRTKGKTVRVKTPICKALKKLNQMRESADITLPNKVMVELSPRDNETWNLVQNMAFNPRVKTSAQLSQSLSQLVSFLEEKWQSVPKERETLSHLRVGPKREVSVNIPSIKSSEYVTSRRLSFISYMGKNGIPIDKIRPLFDQLRALNKNKVKNKTILYQMSQEDDDRGKEAESADGMDNTELLDADLITTTVNQLLLVTSQGNKTEDEEYEMSSNKGEIVSKAKEGWTADNAGSLRIGDLYLMFGDGAKLEMDYWWDMIEIEQQSSKQQNDKEISSVLRQLILLSKFMFEEGESENGSINEDVTAMENVQEFTMVTRNSSSRHASSPETVTHLDAEHLDSGEDAIVIDNECPNKNSDVERQNILVECPPSYLSKTGPFFSFEKQLTKFKKRRPTWKEDRKSKFVKQIIEPNIKEAASYAELSPPSPSHVIQDSDSSLSSNEMKYPSEMSLSSNTPTGKSKNLDVLLEEESKMSTSSTFNWFLESSLPSIIESHKNDTATCFVVPTTSAINTSENPTYRCESPKSCASEGSDWLVRYLQCPPNPRSAKHANDFAPQQMDLQKDSNAIEAVRASLPACNHSSSFAMKCLPNVTRVTELEEDMIGNFKLDMAYAPCPEGRNLR